MNVDYEIIDFLEDKLEYVVVFTDPDGKARKINVRAVVDPTTNRVMKVETIFSIERFINETLNPKPPLTAAQDLVGRKGNTQRKQI